MFRACNFRSRFLSVFLVCISAVSVAQESTNNDLGQYLARNYKKKVLFLRHFYAGEQLKFDATGATVGRVESGLWTLSGIVRIEKIGVSNGRIEIQAKRLLLAVDHGMRLDYAQGDRVVFLAIELDPASATSEKAEELLRKVFLSEADHFEYLVPEYWQACISIAATGGDGKEHCGFSKNLLTIPGVSAGSSASTTQVADVPPSVQSAERVSQSVSAPKPIYTPDPSYTSDAKASQVQGTVTLGVVVSSSGHPATIWIEKPLGYGLDEMAIAAVQTWRFSPALRAGEPVPVKLQIEIDFRLY